MSTPFLVPLQLFLSPPELNWTKRSAALRGISSMEVLSKTLVFNVYLLAFLSVNWLVKTSDNPVLERVRQEDRSKF